jgi:DNA helicase TIP49 (TBP-interacting protein)
MNPQLAFIDSDGNALRDEGMARAADKAERNEEGWGERAQAKLKAYLKYLDRLGLKTFTSEESQLWMVESGLSQPASQNAWGSVFRIAAQRGVIKKTGRYENARRPEAHARAVPVYEKGPKA